MRTKLTGGVTASSSRFTPSWRELPVDIRAHLISHPAQLVEGECPLAAFWEAKLLPTFCGTRRDLRVNRVAPREFGTIE